MSVAASVAIVAAAALAVILLAAGILVVGMLVERWRRKVEIKIVNLTAEELQWFDDCEFKVVHIDYDYTMQIAAVHLVRKHDLRPLRFRNG